jgi:hypothetical protein
MQGLDEVSAGLRYSAPMLGSYNRKEGVIQQVLTPEPIQIKLDSGTDPWVVVIGVGSILSSVVIAVFTYKVQRNQTKASISALRHHWMNEVREVSSEFIQVVTGLINEISQVAEFKSSQSYNEKKSKALRLQIKLNLLLSKDSTLARGIVDGSSELLIDLKKMNYGARVYPYFQQASKLEDMIKDQLENAWRDIQRDYGVTTRRWWQF